MHDACPKCGKNSNYQSARYGWVWKSECGECGHAWEEEEDDDDEPEMRKAYENKETRYYVECPYCNKDQGAEEFPFESVVKCLHCGKDFEVISDN